MWQLWLDFMLQTASVLHYKGLSGKLFAEALCTVEKLLCAMRFGFPKNPFIVQSPALLVKKTTSSALLSQQHQPPQPSPAVWHKGASWCITAPELWHAKKPLYAPLLGLPRMWYFMPHCWGRLRHMRLPGLSVALCCSSGSSCSCSVFFPGIPELALHYSTPTHVWPTPGHSEPPPLAASPYSLT